MILAGRRSIRTRYRPNVWHASDVSTALIGAIVAGLFVAASNVSPSVMTPTVSPPTWPSLSLLSVVGLVIAMIPAFITPTPPKGAS